MKNFLLLSFVILVTVNFSFSQNATLCYLQTDNIKIESPIDIPTITDNVDGTITLTHPDSNISNIFSDYTIYDFYQSFPTSNPNGELFKYYTIVHENKSLINDLHDYLDPNLYSIEHYQQEAINSELISLLDNKIYNLIKYCTASTEQGSTCPEFDQNTPDGFQLQISFNYDATNDEILAETVGISSCGNAFSISLKGALNDGHGSTDKRLQLWTSNSGTSIVSDDNQPCHSIESMLYSVLDIGCQVDHNYGNIRINTNTNESGQFIIERENALFATNYLTFEDNALSVNESVFSQIKPYKTADNPYLQITNLNDTDLIAVEIFTISGQSVFSTNQFKNNTINLSNYNKGLYFIKLSNINNQYKVFKFILK